jgi:enoyl-CoA hydratase/carnithine racemase
MNLLLTGRRVKADEALALGMCDEVVDPVDLRTKARALADEISLSGPLSVRAIRRTMRRGLVERFRTAVDHEQVEQDGSNKLRISVKVSMLRPPGEIPNFEGNKITLFRMLKVSQICY